jgi:NADH-quinone oxidoreductase subunit K
MTISNDQVVMIGVLLLLAIGLYGLLVTRNLIKMVIMLQILTKAAIIALVLAGKVNGQINLGQSLATTVIVVDTVVAVVALALAVQVQHRCGTLDLKKLATLRR